MNDESGIGVIRMQDERLVGVAENPPDTLLDRAYEHLAQLGLTTPDVRPPWRLLGGGVSNWVIRFDVGRGVVVKQALAQLRVREQWLADPRRAILEGYAMAALGERLPAGDVPQVLFVDEDLCLLGMTSAPERAAPWKQSLLHGKADPSDAAGVGALLGRMHSAAWEDGDLAQRFGNLALFEQLRLDPYHEYTARTAEQRGDLITAQALRSGAQEMRENRRTLVHGDFSPKNLLVWDRAIMALDFEVVHWGNPDFDTAFLLTHLALKAIHVPAAAPRYAACARAFLDAYAVALGRRSASVIEAGALRQAGCLISARADGKSPAEYLTAQGRLRARALGAAVLHGAVNSVADLFTFQEDE
jgi:5-methylthioribose kinase